MVTPWEASSRGCGASRTKDAPSDRLVIRARKRLPLPMIMARFMRPCRMASAACPRKGTPEGICPWVWANPGIPRSATKSPIFAFSSCPFITARAAIILKFAVGTSPAPAGRVISGMCSSAAYLSTSAKPSPSFCRGS